MPLRKASTKAAGGSVCAAADVAIVEPASPQVNAAHPEPSVVDAELDPVASRIGVTAVADADHAHDHDVVMNLVDDAELTSACRVAADQHVAKRLADAVGVVGKHLEEEVGAGSRDRLGKGMGECATRGG